MPRTPHHTHAGDAIHRTPVGVEAALRPRWSPARLAYAFYAVAASGAVIGQTWVALTRVPWPPDIPTAARIAAVLPFTLCLELLAMALAAMADERMRVGYVICQDVRTRRVSVGRALGLHGCGRSLCRERPTL